MSYKVIKLNYPDWWNQVGGNFLIQTPNSAGIWGNYKFEINNQVKECNFWIVYEDHQIYLMETAYCSRENCILITGEEKSMWDYPQQYLQQFGRIYTSRDDIQHSKLSKGQHLCVWHIKKNYDELSNSSIPLKTNNLSAIISNATSLEYHKKRYALINRLKGHFKDKLYWYGKGEQSIEDKWDGLAPYKYSVAIENSTHSNYFTEKIMDCYLAYTMPIYWGCPNILEYFPEKSLILVDIEDYLGTIQKIEQAIDENWYDKNLPYIIQARQLVLEKYQFFPKLCEYLDTLQVKKSSKNKTLIKEKSYFTHKFTTKQYLYKKFKNIILYINGYR